MEDEIKDILSDFTKKHEGIKCELQEDILLDIFKIVMDDEKTGKRVTSGIYIQALELSCLSVEDEINIVLNEMISKLRSGTNG